MLASLDANYNGPRAAGVLNGMTSAQVIRAARAAQSMREGA